MERIVLYNKVFLYRGLLINSLELLETLKSSDTGNDKSLTGFSVMNKDFPKDSPICYSVNLKAKKSDENKSYVPVNSFFSVIDEALNDYLSENNLKFLDSRSSNYSINKYNNGGQLHFHTDHNPALLNQECYKKSITSTLYINDDYEGGDLVFKVGTDEFTYRPVAGDVMVFPSNEPYFHKSTPIKSGNKWIAISHLDEYVDAGKFPDWHIK